jgi:hypothetical protein
MARGAKQKYGEVKLLLKMNSKSTKQITQEEKQKEANLKIQERIEKFNKLNKKDESKKLQD